jgi:hypothetical protein
VVSYAADVDERLVVVALEVGAMDVALEDAGRHRAVAGVLGVEEHPLVARLGVEVGHPLKTPCGEAWSIRTRRPLSSRS